MKKIYLYLVLLLSITITKGQTTPALRGLYVDKFATILGNTVKEDSLLNYAKDSSFNYLALYDLHLITMTGTSGNTLANFIRRAHQEFNVTAVGAVGETYNFFATKIAPYNNSRTNVAEKFDVFNLEFEFWINASVGSGGYYCTRYLQQNNCSCDTSGGFKFYMIQLRQIDSLATSMGVTSETYVGWFNQGQAQQLQRTVKRVLLHSYRIDETSVFGYTKTRLQYLTSNNTTLNVAPIFSAEPEFMGPWLVNNSLRKAYTRYTTDFNNDNSTWKTFVNLLGYQWFAYTDLPKNYSGVAASATITASGPTTFCDGGSVTLTASAGTAYQWSNGATTQSIDVNSSGNYSCRVTVNSQSVTTNAISVSVLPAPVVTINVTPGDGNSLLAANVTNVSGSSYKWYQNGNLMANQTSAIYTATTDGIYSVSVIGTNGCSGLSSPVNVTIAAGAPTANPVSCTLTTPSGINVTMVSQTSVLLSWNPIPECDSIVIRFKADNSNVFYFISIPYEGQTSYLIENLLPNTRFTVRIKTVCGTSSSNYSAKKSFTTGSGTSNGRPKNTTTRFAAAFDEETMQIFPMPAIDDLKVSLICEDELNVIAGLYDLSGRAVKEDNVLLIEGDNQISMNVSDVSSGIYILGISTGNFMVTKKVVINH